MKGRRGTMYCVKKKKRKMVREAKGEKDRDLERERVQKRENNSKTM